MVNGILQDIFKSTIYEVAVLKKKVPQAELAERAKQQVPPLNMAVALQKKEVALIAEVKRASPSRGDIRADLDPAALVQTYVNSGAAAISVLTEPRYFKGSREDLLIARKAAGNSIPLLRKDFIFDIYQLYESRAYGADCVLLIVALLGTTNLMELLYWSKELGMTCLVEVHNEKELETALICKAPIIGINNRDLSTFEVDLNTTLRLKPLVPQGKIVVSESGIKSREDVQKLSRCGVNAILVGESLVSSGDVARKIKELLWSE
jgi:indole-3-glycerol phosphate synthase